MAIRADLCECSLALLKVCEPGNDLCSDGYISRLKQLISDTSVIELSFIFKLDVPDLSSRVDAIVKSFSVKEFEGDVTEDYYNKFHQVVVALLLLVPSCHVNNDEFSIPGANLEPFLIILLDTLLNSLYIQRNRCSKEMKSSSAIIKLDENNDRKEDIKMLLQYIVGNCPGANLRLTEFVTRVQGIVNTTSKIKGLYNPDNLCYACSTLQALFTSTKFRKAILEGNFTPEENKEEDLASAVAQELQKIFVLLSHSLLDYVDIEPFMNAYFKYQQARLKQGVFVFSGDLDPSSSSDESTPFSASEQCDAVAFLSELLSLLQIVYSKTEAKQNVGCLLNNSQAHVLVSGNWTNVLEGIVRKVCSEGEQTAIICRKSEKIERFNIFQLNVVNPVYENVSEEAFAMDKAINAYFRPKPVNYQWPRSIEGDSALLRPVETVMRTLPTLWPPVLLVQPKRFSVNQERFERIKLRNSEGRFTFRPLLDLTPHNGGEYTLVCVVIHSGTATDGHYYSFVKSLSSTDTKKRPWAWCDDDEVHGCSYRRVMCEAASYEASIDSYALNTEEGEEEEDEDDWTVDDETSAYLLVYVRTEDLKLEHTEISEELQTVVNNANIEYCIDFLLGDL